VEIKRATSVASPNVRELGPPKRDPPSNVNRDNVGSRLPRNPTQTSPSGSSSGISIEEPVRALSVQKQNDARTVAPDNISPAPLKGKKLLQSFRLACIDWCLATTSKEKNSRLTEFYDDYLDSYDDSSAPVPSVPKLLVAPDDSAAAWARSNATGVPPISVSRTNSRGPYASSYALGSGSGMRRKLSRRPTQRGFRMQSTYREDEEEGYASGDYDDDEFYELMKIRIKVCFNSLVGNDNQSSSHPSDPLQR